MNNEIGIGILDLYTEEDIQNCYNSIPQELHENVFVVSNNNNKAIISNTKQYSSPIQLATMRNWLISQMRIKGLKYYFLIHSNQTIKDSNIFENTIKLAETFGTWVVMGPSTDNVPMEDDESNLTLNLSVNMNTEFMFLFSGIVKTFGYFDERYFNGKEIDVLDYILKLRAKNAYPPSNYHPTIVDGIESNKKPINKMGLKDIPDTDKSVQVSYAYFFNNHKYIPTQNDPKFVTTDVLLVEMEKIQKNYAKPRK